METIETLAAELARLAASVDEPRISCRLAEMADEVLGLADQPAADSPIYHSATFFLHMGRTHTASDPYADDRSLNPTQCN